MHLYLNLSLFHLTLLILVLAISFVKYGNEDFKTQAVPHDISGIKYHILNGGQGYKVGDQITVLQGTNQYGKQVTVDTTKMVAGPFTSGAAIQQAAYKITHITATPGAGAVGASPAGTIVSLSITGGADQTGHLHAPITAGGSQTIQIISPLNQNFDSALGDTLTIGTGPGVPCTDEVIPGVENSRKGAVSGFLTNASAAAGPTTGPTFYQTLAQFQTRQFEAVCSPYTLDATGATIITAVEAEKGTIQPFAATDAELDTSTAALANTGKVNGASIIEGRLTAEVTSVVSTKPDQGRK